MRVCTPAPRRSGRVSWLVLAAALSAAAPARAETVTIVAARDATLYAEDGALANGAGDHLFAGLTADGFERRALVSFDLAAVPPGATVTAATVTLTLSRTQTQDLLLALHPVTAGWGEGASHASGEEGAGATAMVGDATWTHRLYPSSSWASRGGDFAAEASATTIIGR